MTWIQLVLTKKMENDLSKKAQARLTELAKNYPNSFVQIADGLEGMTRAINLETVRTASELLTSIKEGEMLRSRVILSKETGCDAILDNAYDFYKGYHRGEMICFLHHRHG